MSKELPLKVTISEDRKKASLIPLMPLTGQFNLDEIIEYLNSKNVLFGIKKEYIQEILIAGQVGHEYWVAESSPPYVGVQFTFQRTNLNPVKKNDGSVDFKNLDYIPNIKKGSTLAFVVSPTDERQGILVDGEKFSDNSMIQTLPECGENVSLSQDQQALIAEIDGYPYQSENTLSIKDQFQLKGDVSQRTGNLNCIAGIHILGGIQGGLQVEAKGDIQIDQFIEDATIISEKSIILRDSFFGRDRGQVIAGENIEMVYAEGGSILSGKNVVLKLGARNVKLVAKGCVDVDLQDNVLEEKLKVVMNSHIIAHRSINLIHVGGQRDTETILEIPYPLPLAENLNVHIQDMMNYKEVLKEDFSWLKLYQDKIPESRNYLMSLKKVNDFYKLLTDEYQNYQSLVKQLNIGQHIDDNYIKIMGRIYSGVTLRIHGISFVVSENMDHVIFRENNGIISVEKL